MLIMEERVTIEREDGDENNAKKKPLSNMIKTYIHFPKKKL